MASDALFPDLTPAELAIENALRLDGWDVERLQQLKPVLPDIIASYNGQIVAVRVPVIDYGEVATQPESNEELNWDESWGGKLIVSSDTSAILSAVLGLPSPTVADDGGAFPAGLFSMAALTFDTGTATQTVPGGWSADSAVLRAKAGTYSFPSAELWFRWNGDATAASGTTRQVSLIVRETDGNNALLASWRWAPTATGVYVQRQVSGTYTAETATATTVPAAPTDGRWHHLRADIIGTTITVRADRVIVWQGTLSSPAQAISGGPGVQADNARFDFILWTPPTPSSASVIQMDITPQVARPQQGINTVSGATSSDSPTWELIQASGKTDRLSLVSAVSGFTGLGVKFSPVSGDVSVSNGRRASLKGTTYTTQAFSAPNNRKYLPAHDGCRTRDTFKFRFPTGSLPTGQPLGIWGLLWQWHQSLGGGGPSPRVGTSPPIQLNFKQHKYSGLYWLFLSYDGNFYGGNYESFQLADGTWPLGGEILWNSLLQLDHSYQFVFDITHSASPTAGKISMWVDGVQVVTNHVGLNMYDSFNFLDITVYENPSAVGRRYGIGGDYSNEHIPGPNCPLLPYYTAP